MRVRASGGILAYAMSENVDLVRSIYVHVERGELNVAKWAHPDIEWVMADGPEPGARVGVAAMEKGLGDVLDAWENYRIRVEEYRELDTERVLVLIQRSGRGRVSGLELGEMRTSGASLYYIRSGRITRLVNYLDRERAFADLGIEA
jgi:ketosteroid isomerase-like protein